MSNCSICKRLLKDKNDPILSEDCGGDCIVCMAEAGDPECIESLYKHGMKAFKALREVNNTIFADGAPMASANYWQIRKLCIEVLCNREVKYD